MTTEALCQQLRTTIPGKIVAAQLRASLREIETSLIFRETAVETVGKLSI